MPYRASLVALSFLSIGILLLHLFNALAMSRGALFLLLPSLFFLAVAYFRAEGELKDDLTLGLVGGLIGTAGYDLFRVPFVVFGGYRLFASIRAFGVWILDSPCSTVWTEIVGWSYHLSNGLTFGLIYALVARRRHWAWGIVWGLLVELIAVGSPFGDKFNLTANPSALTVAFAGHVAYGLPLGIACQYREATLKWWNDLEKALKWAGAVVLTLLLLQPLLHPGLRQRFSTPSAPATLEAHPPYLLPEWCRFQGELTLSNPSEQTVKVKVAGASYELKSGEQRKVLLEVGVHQVRLETQGRSISSFAEVLP